MSTDPEPARSASRRFGGHRLIETSLPSYELPRQNVARVSVVSKGLLKRASREVLVQVVVRARPASPPA